MRALGLTPSLVLLLAIVVPASAAEDRGPDKPKLAPVVKFDLKHDLSPPLFLMRPKRDSDVTASTHEPLTLPKARRAPAGAPAFPERDEAHERAAAFPVEPAPIGMPPPILSFAGVSNRNGVAPPDTNGDVGPNHYVQWVNLSYAVWNKQGALVFGPVNGNTIWAGLGGMCELRNNGDPIVLYDPMADRWLLSQLAFIDPANGNPGEYHQCVAVSQTPDPTGAWYRYDFLFSTTMLNDYPKFGVWPDAYYLGVNQFAGLNPRTFAGQGVMAFEREKLLQGLPAQTIYFDLFAVNAEFGGAIPADLDGPTLPPPGAPNVFVAVDDDGFGWTPIDRLSLWNFHVDWTTPASSTFGISGNPDQVIDLTAAGASIDTEMCGQSSFCIPQLGTTRRVAAISDRLMYRVVYRSWPDHESLTLNHTVDVDGTDHAGIRWYELRRSGGAYALYQSGTHAPDALHRWMASAAMDGSGDFAVGYNVSHETINPTIRYAGRVPGDPLGTLPRLEATLFSGTGAQTGLNRWGDYSMLSVDPVDDCTFWYTQESYSTTTEKDWMTRVGSFRFPECVACAQVPTPTLTLEKVGSDTRLDWTTEGKPTEFDIVEGDLSLLRSSSGDYAVATTECEAGRRSAPPWLVTDANPHPDAGTFFLVRAIALQCRGTYDDLSRTHRDAEIAASPGACP